MLISHNLYRTFSATVSLEPLFQKMYDSQYICDFTYQELYQQLYYIPAW